MVEKKVSEDVCAERHKSIDEKLDKIIGNDLVHVNEKLDKLEEKVIPLSFIEKIIWIVVGAAAVFLFNMAVTG